jgi:hypothetical protein
MLANVAEDSVATHLDINLEDILIETQAVEDNTNVEAVIVNGKIQLQELNTSTPSESSKELPAGIKHAILLMIGNLYANREPISYGAVIKVPYTLDYLLGLYKNYKHS